jgi:hypothetical protein
MLHACFAPIAVCFIYTLWRFYAFSETNLLTRCHSASSLFSAIFCFRKATQEIFLELDETKPEPPIFPRHETKSEGESEEGQGSATPRGGASPLGRARGWCGPPGRPLTPPLRLYKAFRRQNPKSIGVSPENYRSAAAVEDQFRGT